MGWDRSLLAPHPCCAAHHAPPPKARGAMGCLAQDTAPHGCGRHRHFHGAMTTCFTGTKSKLCSETPIINPPHPTLLQAVPAPCMVPCPFCSKKPPAPGSPCLPACPPALTLSGFSGPIAAPQCPWPMEGLPSHGHRQRGHGALAQQAHGVQAPKLMATAVLSPAPSPINSLFPPGTILPAHCHKQMPCILTLGSKDLSLLL